MLRNATRRTVLRLMLLAAALAGLGYAARLGEDGLLYSSGNVSFALFALAGIVFYYALLTAFVLFRRRRARPPRRAA